MKIRPVTAELFNVDRHDKANSRSSYILKLDFFVLQWDSYII